jgi:hypothetical protein
VTAVPEAPHGPAAPALGWATLLAEPFAGTEVNTDLWYLGGIPDPATFPITIGYNTGPTPAPPTPSGIWNAFSANMLAVVDGILSMTLQAVPDGGTVTTGPTVGGVSTVYSYIGPCIQSSPGSAPGQTGFLFNPGAQDVVMEAYIKVPPGGNGSWPAWWASTQAVPAQKWTHEVDAFEMRGNVTPQLNEHDILPGSGGAFCNRQAGPFFATGLGDLSTAFHWYTAYIHGATGQVDYYIDSNLIHSFTGVTPWTPEEQMVLLLYIQLSDPSPTNLPLVMEVGSVAVYAANVEPVVPSLDVNNKLVPQARDTTSSAVFTASQTASSIYNGILNRFDTTAGAISQPMPTAPTVGTKVGFRRLDVTGNLLTLTAGGTDTFEDAPYNATSAPVGPGVTVWYIYTATGAWSVLEGARSDTGLLAAVVTSGTGATGAVPTIPYPNGLAVQMDPTYGAELYQKQSGSVVKVHGQTAVLLPNPSTTGADDAIAVNAAIAAGAPGCEVNIPQGALYQIQSTVVLLPNRRYRFGHRWPANSSSPPTAGTTTFGFRVANGANLDFAVASPAALQTGTGLYSNNPTDIEGILVDGNKANQTSGKGILLAVAGWRSIVKDFGLYNGRGHGLNLTCDTADGHQMSGNAYENHIDGGTVDGCNGHGIYSPDITDSWIRDVVCSNIGLTGILVTNLEGWQIYGNHLWDCGIDGMNLQRWYASGVHDNYIEGFGVAQSTTWSSTTTYDRYAVVIQGGGIYYSLAEGNLNNTPSTDAGVHWQPGNLGNGSVYGIGAWQGGNARPLDLYSNKASIGHITLAIAPINYHCFCVQSGSTTGGNGLSTGIGSYLNLYGNSALNEYPNGVGAQLSRAYKLQLQSGGAMAADGLSTTPSGVGRNGHIGTFSAADSVDSGITTWARQ